MNKLLTISFLVLLTTLSFAQQKEKVKGSKIVTVVQKEVGEFESVEIEDNLEIFLLSIRP